MGEAEPTPLSQQDRLAIVKGQYRGLDPEWVRLWNDHGSGMVRSDEVSPQEYRLDPAKYTLTYPLYGGGWVIGNLQTDAAWCSHICNQSKIKVIDVDYRLAPEFRFPTAIYDCWDAVRWARENAKVLNIQRDSISYGGISAGGHMSAVLNFFARDENVPVKCSLVVVPATDMRYLHPRNKRLNEKNCPYESARLFQGVPWSPMGREQWFLKYWLGDDEAVQDEILNNDWRMTPILAPDFKNLPPTHFVTAEFDLARDETKVFEELLRHAGNQVTSKQYAGMPHAFAMYNHPTRGLAKSWEYLEDTARLLREAHGCADL